ncbi:helix-turn-helix transcriptional regulator [Parasedimentitalea huanghaiensis]|uniref:HTH domain-containing protein n=1 Tax=Parasedimentitalea huanghaiensis TaxID=2682100 RepID=A0A6L6WFX4_9RHOB|nr:YafY family protein [Zongyanglinia huanghaiensis]MVO16178.1 HTH domain-containing protein [Zongyanglinia huanghaiensis]
MRSARMFEIIQLLRSANGPCTAQNIADILEVTKRTIYRDIASLQSMRVPIEGEAGIGYVMRPGYNLPPVNFDIEEAEAISVGLSMISRTGDKSLEKAALRAMRKLSEATQLSENLFSSSWGAKVPGHIDLAEIRNAIRQETKLGLIYQDVEHKSTKRKIRPIALVYYAEAVVIAAWCELRHDFRHFRSDRILSCDLLTEGFEGEGVELRRKWAEVQDTDF